MTSPIPLPPVSGTESSSAFDPHGSDGVGTQPTRVLQATGAASALGSGFATGIRPGARFGDFEIRAKLGEGGMGSVYEAWDTSLERPVALKVISPGFASSPEAKSRLRAEALSVARLSHINIVAVHACGERDGIAYIALEMVRGRDLSTRIAQDGPLQPEDALRAIRQAALALQFAYARHVIHRDVKPANLLQLPDGTIKVADFGLAKRLDSDMSLTSTDVVVGSPAYMAPEQGLGEPLDFRADIYSLGCTLYALLTAHAPYEGSTPVAVMVQHANAPIPTLPKAIGTAQPELQNLLERMMAKAPAGRFSDYEELIARIDRAIAVVRGEAKPTPTAAPRAWAWPVAIAACAGAIVFSSILLFRSGGGELAAAPAPAADVAAPFAVADEPVATAPVEVASAEPLQAPRQQFSDASGFQPARPIRNAMVGAANASALVDALDRGAFGEARNAVARLAESPTQGDFEHDRLASLSEAITIVDQYDRALHGEVVQRGSIDLVRPNASATIAATAEGRVTMRANNAAPVDLDWIQLPPMTRVVLSQDIGPRVSLTAGRTEFAAALYESWFARSGEDGAHRAPATSSFDSATASRDELRLWQAWNELIALRDARSRMRNLGGRFERRMQQGQPPQNGEQSSPGLQTGTRRPPRD